VTGPESPFWNLRVIDRCEKADAYVWVCLACPKIPVEERPRKPNASGEGGRGRWWDKHGNRVHDCGYATFGLAWEGWLVHEADHHGGIGRPVPYEVAAAQR